jgi:hypothetical protein
MTDEMTYFMTIELITGVNRLMAKASKPLGSLPIRLNPLSL